MLWFFLDYAGTMEGFGSAEILVHRPESAAMTSYASRPIITLPLHARTHLSTAASVSHRARSKDSVSSWPAYVPTNTPLCMMGSLARSIHRPLGPRSVTPPHQHSNPQKLLRAREKKSSQTMKIIISQKKNKKKIHLACRWRVGFDPRPHHMHTAS